MADQHEIADSGEEGGGRATIASGRDAGPDARGNRPANDKHRPIREVRATDIEPYTGLRYLSKLFRLMSVILILLLIAEVVTGLYTQGTAAIPTLIGEASRLIVLAGVLWGTGDLAHLLIDVGHDVRAARIMVARATHAGRPAPSPSVRAGDRGRTEIPVADRPATHDDRVDRSGDDHGPPIP